MDERQMTIGALALGAVLVLVGSLSDVIGFGAEGFGPGQVILIVVGAALLGYGLWRYSQTANR